MMKMFILGLLTMSLISTIGILIRENKSELLGEEVGYCIIGGPVCTMYCLIVLSVRFVITTFEKYNIKSLVVCPDNQIRWVNFKDANYLVYNLDGYNFPKFKDLNENANLWNKNYRSNFAGEHSGNVRYCPKKVWKKYDPVSKEDIKRGKEKEKEKE